MTMPLENMAAHHDLRAVEVADVHAFDPTDEVGASKYYAPLPRGARVDALLVNKRSDVLLVAMHGATDRAKKQLPRFEYFRTLRKTEFSSLYLSDPTLHLGANLELAWYTGWLELDLYPILADWARRAAQAVGAQKIVFLGSSGGGLASLQTSTYIAGSMALPFSPQTSIDSYLVGGTRLSAQRGYMRHVMPHLTPATGLQSLEVGQGYFESLGERASAILRYQREQRNFVHYVQNVNDSVHFHQHYLPFRKAVTDGPNAARIEFELQEDERGHNPPREPFMLAALRSAVARVRAVSSPRGGQ